MDKLLIVDGHNLLFQMFYGMPSRIINGQGKAINGVLGFVGALLKIIKIVSPTHIIVLFDGEHENSRTQVDPDYKKNRQDYSDIPDEDNPFSQLGYIYSALEFIGIKFFEEDKYEVDDVIASYVYKYRDTAEIVISSFDSDYFQLIDDNVIVLRYRGMNTQICDKTYIKEKFGILPEFYADFKSLTGDKADNIKGAENVGVKTASALINEFGSLEYILKNSEKIKPERIRLSVERSATRLKNNYEIIRLRNLNKIPYEIEELDFTVEGIDTRSVLRGIGLMN